MQSNLTEYKNYLLQEEKSGRTIDKYIRDVQGFLNYLDERELNKQEVMSFKKIICEKYAPASVNSKLVSVNLYLEYIGRTECKVKMMKIQQQIFISEKKELTISEYRKLLQSADSVRLRHVIQTICETGIRVSELPFITVEAVAEGRAVVHCKNKTRVILIPKQLRIVLLEYIETHRLESGSLFVTKSGQPLNRSNIWRDMKKLCDKAGIEPQKIYPHNLRRLFARTYYSIDQDIVRLADLLGHSNINTTRIYTIDSGKQHVRCMDMIHHKLMI